MEEASCTLNMSWWSIAFTLEKLPSLVLYYMSHGDWKLKNPAFYDQGDVSMNLIEGCFVLMNLPLLCCTLSFLNWYIPDSRSVMIHQLSKGLTQKVPFKTKGIPVVSTTFHPKLSIFFTATKKDVRVYDLLKQKRIKKLDAGVREISSLAIHPGGMCFTSCWLPVDLDQTCWQYFLAC